MSDETKPVDVLPEVKPCPFCGGDEVHRHGSDPKHVVLTHVNDCHLGRITVFKEGDPKLAKWNVRAA